VTTGYSVESVYLQRDVEAFLYYEAELLDDRRFEDWLTLFHDDVHYWVPTRRNLGRRQLRDFSEPDELAHFDDDRATLAMRVARLKTSFAWAEQPPSRTRRIIGNVRITRGEDADRFSVRSNFLCRCDRFETDSENWSGERHDVLTRRDGNWLIASRMVIVDQTVLQANSVSIFF
jgi:3-phenylpropionate/cinnamic acid dioxygenase small subunit